MKILVVEDDENSRIYLERALKTQGYIVEGAVNGAVALEKALNSPPDIIISDAMMPVMDGFELCRKIKADKLLANIPFIFYTSTYSEKKDQELARSLGATRYILKPFDMDDFFRVIKETIGEFKVNKPIASEISAVEKERIDELYTKTIARKLEKKVQELEKANEELRKKNAELETMINGFVGQELRIVEYKREIQELKKKIGEKTRTDQL